MLLSIIIVSYNTKDLLKQCLDSIIKSLTDYPLIDNKQQTSSKRVTARDQASSFSYEIIIVDNNSQDGTKEFLKEYQKTHPFIKTIFNKENLGFAKAVNQGVKKSRGKYILLLNSDINVLPGAIEKLISFAEQKKDVGVVAPKLLNSDKTPQPSCYHLPTIKRAIDEYWRGKRGAYEKYLPRGGNPVKVEAVVGAAMLIPRVVIDVVGLLDEKYFMYFEDLDYCQRIRKNGFSVYYLPSARLIHHHGASGKGKHKKMNRYLVESSKKFNGILKYNLLKLIISLSNIKKFIFIFFLILIALFWGIKSLLVIDYFSSHDGAFHLIRLFEFHKSVKEGKIPPRWAPGLAYGLGVPVFNFYYPLSYYLGEFLYLFFGSFSFSIRTLFVLGYFMGFFFAYLFLANFFSKIASLLGAFFYVFSPYIFLDIYVRGNLPEFLALMFLPGVFWVFEQTLRNPRKNYYWFLGSFLLAFFIMAHNIVSLLGVAWLFLFLFFSLLRIKMENKKVLAEKVMGIVAIFLFGLGMAAFFWLPALGEINLTYLSRERVFSWWNHFPTLKQLFYSPWGYGSSVIGAGDEMSFQIGIVHIFLALIAGVLFMIYVFERKINPFFYKNGLILFFSLSSFLLIFLMNHRSSFIWQHSPFLYRVQFPWRLLGFLMFSLLPLIAFLFEEVFKRRLSRWSYVFTAFILLSSFLCGALAFLFSIPFLPALYPIIVNRRTSPASNVTPLIVIGA